MRWQISIFLVLALGIFVFRQQITGLLGASFGDVSFLGLPLATDWASIALLLVFTLGLVIEIYLGFLWFRDFAASPISKEVA